MSDLWSHRYGIHDRAESQLLSWFHVNQHSHQLHPGTHMLRKNIAEGRIFPVIHEEIVWGFQTPLIVFVYPVYKNNNSMKLVTLPFFASM